MAEGLDCVGLAGLAYEMAVPRGYALRSGEARRVIEAVATAGLVPVATPAAGDLLLMRSAPGQLHLGVATEAGMIHADAGLRRVVERPGAPPWPVIGRWRKGE